MAHSIRAWLDARQTTSDPHGFVRAMEVPAADLAEDVAAAIARMRRIFAARAPANHHDDLLEAPMPGERGCLPLLPLLGAGAPHHNDAGARITTG